MNTTNAVAQVDFFIKNVQAYLKEAILVLDFEADAIDAHGVAGTKAFLDRVKEKTGVAALIYMSASVTRQFDWSSVAKNHALWVAQYADMNPTGYQSNLWKDGKGFGAWSSPAIYQYSSTGRISGYGGNLDINLSLY